MREAIAASGMHPEQNNDLGASAHGGDCLIDQRFIGANPFDFEDLTAFALK